MNIDKELLQKYTPFLVVGFSLFVFVYFYFFTVFLENHFWWVLPLVFYLVFFFARDKQMHILQDERNLRVKNRKEIRVKFWGYCGMKN